jgi:hypothetical protein
MVPVQGFLTALLKANSSEIRQALWAMGMEIDKDDLIDLDEIDQEKLKKALKEVK